MEDAFTQVAALCAEVDGTGLLAQVGLDPMGVGAIVDALAEVGIAGNDRVVGIPQGWTLNGAIKTTEIKLASGALVHAPQRIMDWAVGNAKAEPKGNAITITKQAAGTGKIDPVMALFDAVVLMSRNPEAAGRSFWEADCIGQNVSLAAFDHLFSGIATRPSGFRGLHRLAVDDARGRAGLAPGRLAHRHQQYVVDRFPGSVVAPAVEVPLHRCEGRELLGQHAPLATTLGDVEDRVDRRAQAGSALAPTTGGRRQVGFDEGPFGIGGVACIAQATALILGTRDFSPGHDGFLVVFANTKESRPLKSRNFFHAGWITLAQNAEMTHTVIAKPFRVSLLATCPTFGDQLSPSGSGRAVSTR
jgi:hypothetical protein